jgi:hypothetical protein
MLKQLRELIAVVAIQLYFGVEQPGTAQKKKIRFFFLRTVKTEHSAVIESPEKSLLPAINIIK